MKKREVDYYTARRLSDGAPEESFRKKKLKKKKKYKKVDVAGTVTSTCDRDRSLLIRSMCEIFLPHTILTTLVNMHGFINKLLERYL